MSRRVLSSLVLAGLAAGCSLAPEPRVPAVEAAPEWRAEAPPVPGAIAPEWWTAFGDPTLDALVAEALEQNRDLRLAVARLDETRALARIAGADKLPSVDLEGSASRSKRSTRTDTLPPGIDPYSDDYRLAASVSFELDLFGRVRNQATAALDELLAAESTRDAVRLAVASDVASAYFGLLALDRQVAVTRETVDARRRTEELIRLRYEGGLASRLDLERTRGERASAEAALPEIERLRRSLENRLALLLGRLPGEIARGVALEAIAAPEVPTGLPSDLLLRRPDVAAAEARLAATAARIGVARAALFPSIRLTGYYGGESSDLSNLFASGASIWQLAAGLLQPIFDGGRNRALVAAAEARQEQAVVLYLQTAEGAFRDVEDALFAVTSRRARRAALAEQSSALEAALVLARDRYAEGEASYLEVLDVERARLAAALELAGARRDELDAAVSLFRALGAGEAPSRRPPDLLRS
ncbi:MAG: efflux transporter outer membrane subunit [Holophagales bacterium]|nr:efflux transporter outer membrane subunit [Holophagales bacterium]